MDVPRSPGLVPGKADVPRLRLGTGLRATSTTVRGPEKTVGGTMAGFSDQVRYGNGMKMQSGFTLVELMIVIVVLAIILTLGVPSFRSIIQNNRATTAANDLVAALQTARSEALKLRADVTVCPSAGGAACAAAGSRDWSVGWIICTGACAGADDVIRAWRPVPGTGSATADIGGGITFRPTGLVAAGRSIDVVIPDCTGNHLYTIDVALSGQVNQTRGACP